MNSTLFQSPRDAALFWLRWIAACAVGWAVAGIFSASMIPAFFGWALFGLGQWLVLRKLLRPAAFWIVLSGLAGFLGIGAFAGLEVLIDRHDPPMVRDLLVDSRIPGGADPTPATGADELTEQDKVAMRDQAYWLWAVAGALLGSLMGGLQWVELRRRVSRAGWWVAANALGWAAGALIAGVFLVPVIEAGFEGGLKIPDLILPVLLGGALTGVAASGALLLMMRSGEFSHASADQSS